MCKEFLSISSCEEKEFPGLLKFDALLQKTIWGGKRITALKEFGEAIDHIGESWEISGLKDSESSVADGIYKGYTVGQMITLFKEDLLGKRNYQLYGNQFPLLVKFLDVNADLSIQVHPNDEQARARGYERGKTEIWYVVDAIPGAKLVSGLKEVLKPDGFQKSIDDGTICDFLHHVSVSKGDSYFIPAGHIHAAGAGVFLIEIQQTSNITYRIFDYNRPDINGQLRELHIEEAKSVVNMSSVNDHKISYQPAWNKRVELKRCDYFTTSVYEMNQSQSVDYSSLDSFVVWIAFEGSAVLTDNDGNSTHLRAGESVLIPAIASEINVSVESGTFKFIETYC